MMTLVTKVGLITIIIDTMITNLSTAITLELMMVVLIIIKNTASIMDHITITSMVPTITKKKNIMDPIIIMSIPPSIIIMTMHPIIIRSTIPLTIIIITTLVIRDMMKNLMAELIIKSIIITTTIITKKRRLKMIKRMIRI